MPQELIGYGFSGHRIVQVQHILDDIIAKRILYERQ